MRDHGPPRLPGVEAPEGSPQGLGIRGRQREGQVQQTRVLAHYPRRGQREGVQGAAVIVDPGGFELEESRHPAVDGGVVGVSRDAELVEGEELFRHRRDKMRHTHENKNAKKTRGGDVLSGCRGGGGGGA